MLTYKSYANVNLDPDIYPFSFITLVFSTLADYNLDKKLIVS